MCFGRTPLSMAKWYLVLIHGTCTIEVFTWYLVLVHYVIYGTCYLALWPMGTWYLGKNTIKALWAIHVAVLWLVWRKDNFELKKYMAINLGNVWQSKQICPTGAAAAAAA